MKDILSDLQKNWDAFGKVDALWSILTEPGKRDNKWDVEAFFRTGQEFVDFWIEHLSSLPIPIARGRALDFGCGAGRITQALCGHFRECDGIDIAPSMIKLAQKYNRHGDNCHYQVTMDDGLPIFESCSFDFIITVIVLQHIPPPHNRNYSTSFLRILRPGGMLLFQVPSELKSVARLEINPPLPAEGFRAYIKVVNAPSSLECGRPATVTVRVRNESPVHWPAVGTGAVRIIQLGNHWCDAQGLVIFLDDGRVPLPCGVGPGETVELALPIRAPLHPGTFRLQLDLVQEQVAWFADKGSALAELTLPVATAELSTLVPDLTGPSSNESADPDVFVPVMQMHGIPRNEVVTLVESHGGRILDLREDNSSGDEWNSYMYIVQKL